MSTLCVSVLLLINPSFHSLDHLVLCYHIQDQLFQTSLGKPKGQHFLFVHRNWVLCFQFYRVGMDATPIACELERHRTGTRRTLDRPCDGILYAGGVRGQRPSTVASVRLPDPGLHPDFEFWVDTEHDFPTEGKTGGTHVLGPVFGGGLHQSYSAA